MRVNAGKVVPASNLISYAKASVGVQMNALESLQGAHVMEEALPAVRTAVFASK
jgi:hypothetical protein